MSEDFAAHRDRLARERREHRWDALVDQAVGVVMARSGCGSAEAVAQLAAIARRSGRPLRAVAADVVAEAAGLAADAPPDPDVVRLHPEVAALDRSADGDELARSLVTEALGYSRPSGAVIGVLDDDGTVAILGSTGFPAREIRRWRRIPPAVDTLINRAVRSGAPVWIDDDSEDRPVVIGQSGTGPHGTRVAVPLRSGRMLIGVVLLAWRPMPASGHGSGPGSGGAAGALDDRARREVEAVVQAAGPALLRMLGEDLHGAESAAAGVAGGTTGAVAESPWQDVVDLLDVPALVVTGLEAMPVTADRLHVTARNEAAADLMLPGADRSLEAAAPWLATDDVVEALAVVARTGTPRRHPVKTGRLGVEAVSAVRAGGVTSVLVVAHSTAEPATEVDATLERLGRFGTWTWDAAGDRVRWSPEALRIMGAPALGDPTGINRPPYTVHPDDAEAERRFIKTLTTEGRPAEVEFRIVHYGGEPTRVRLAAEPVPGRHGAGSGGSGGSDTLDRAHGADRADTDRAESDRADRAAGSTAPSRPATAPERIVGVIQDVTDWRRSETALEVARVQLAAQRSRADAERNLASALQQAIVPGAARNEPPHTGVEVAARYRPASAAAGVGGDWYSVFPLRDAQLLLAIGDVAGHGLPAASAMADVHHGLRGMALAENRPGRLLTLLNELVDSMPEFTIASACCLLWDPARRVVRWGNAGHPAPIRVRGGAAETIEDHVGPMLGADSQAVYEDCDLAVESGDVLLLYTDGLVERRRAGDDETTAYLLGQARDPDPDLGRYLDRILAGARSDTDDDVCVLAVRFE
ncbi:SpoIIE family protein phosphatase [Catenulispora subtropica]|uniref:SpoIIE family protein phosphatase n=1 Tax=Catenulispora subtropica TaxID=450798 RepID=A0ABN2T919_9ACTN